MSIQINGHIKNIDSEGLLVSLEDDGACHSCGLHGFCHEKQVRLPLPVMGATEVLNTGDTIRLTYQKITRDSILLYLLPLIFVFGCLFVQNQSAPALPEIYQILFALGGLLCGLFLVYLLSRKFHGQSEIIIEKIK